MVVTRCQGVKRASGNRSRSFLHRDDKRPAQPDYLVFIKAYEKSQALSPAQLKRARLQAVP